MVSPATAPMQVRVSEPCPQEIGSADGVSNPGAGDQLVPPQPLAGLICRYAPPAPYNQSSEVPAGSLYAQVKLSRQEAVRLAGAVDAISTAAPTGTSSCPSDRLSVSIIAFSYPSIPDFDLWFKDSGCETLDNGRVGASETGNPMFSDAFDPLIEAWAPALP